MKRHFWLMSFALQTGQNSHQFSDLSGLLVGDSDWLMRFAMSLSGGDQIEKFDFQR
jgi:hypothetical protein